MTGTYGGGLFAPLSRRDFLALRRQFLEIIPINPRCIHQGRDVVDLKCHGYGDVYAMARHAVRTRDDIEREKGLDH